MADPVRLLCPQCRTAYRLKVGVRPGATVKCSKCGAGMVVPEPAAVPPIAGKSEFAGSSDDRQVSLGPEREAPTMTLPDGGSEEGVDMVLKEADPNAGRYIEQAVIGRGGMGEVALCIDRNTRRQVALKRILPHAASDPARRARFVEEAQVTAQLEHPNIVPVHELDRTPDGTVYFTMKLVKGRSLADIIKAAKEGKEPLNLAEQLQVFLKVCDGVAFAHSRGVIHRDLKPANIMVGEYGEVLVMDWGLAKVGGREDIRGGDLVTSSRVESGEAMTMQGATVGTPAYMPPEQANGELDKIDPRSDIYSLGAILYEILTLERAIEGKTPMMVLANAARNRIVPIEKRAAGRHVPRELAAIAMKCLAKTRAGRYRSVLDLRRDIALFLGGRSVSASPDSFAQATVKLIKRNKGISAAIAAAAIVLIAITIGFLIGLKGQRDRALASEHRALDNEKKVIAAEARRREMALGASERFAKQAVGTAEYHRWEEAEQRAADSATVCPDGPWALYAQGRFAQIRREHEKAVEILQRAQAVDSKNSDIAAALTESQAFLKDIENAEKIATGGSAPGDWEALEKLAETMMSGERWRQAEKLFLGAVRIVERASNIPPEAKVSILERLNFRLGEAKAWIACEGFHDSIKSLPPAEQVQRVEAKLTEVNGQPIRFASVEIKEGKWVGANLYERPVKYLSPLSGLPLAALYFVRSQVRDLSPLMGMPLTSLECRQTGVIDLSPLKGMPLTSLEIRNTGVADLSPLKGMPLTNLLCHATKVSDLSLLKGMPLTFLDCNGTGVSDLSPLKGMPLTHFECHWTGVSDLIPLKGMPLRLLSFNDTKVTDLGPLEGLKLEQLTFTPKAITRGIEIVRSMKSIKGIGIEFYKWMSPDEFWKKYDAGEFK